MASSLAAQLSQIASNSSNALNLKAQKASHSKSLIFEPRVAASQSFDTLYTICHEGFQELCLLDGRFLDFQRTLFSDQSLEQDRTQMTGAENAELDKKLEDFLGLVGGRLRLSPAVKAVEWLIRRFRIHEHNTSFLLTTFLPYHTLPIFTTLLSILPKTIPTTYKFLHPYIRSLTTPPRHAIVYTATNNVAFAALLNSYILRVSGARQQYPALLSFWAGVMTEAVSGMLDKSRSGIKGVQLQNEQEVILRLLPTLNEGLAAKKVPELRVGCYMILAVMASKGDLDDKLLTAMMEAVVQGWTADTFTPGLVCLTILAQYRGAKQLPKSLMKGLLKVEGLSSILLEISEQHRVEKLVNGLCLALIQRLAKTGDAAVLPIFEQLVSNDLLTDAQAIVIVKVCIVAAHQLDDVVDKDGSARSQLAVCLSSLAEHPARIGNLTRQAMEESTIDLDELEMKLKVVVRPKMLLPVDAEDEVMVDTPALKQASSTTFEELFSALPARTEREESFISHSTTQIYDELSQVFACSVTSQEHVRLFTDAPILAKESALDNSLFLSFFIRIWCGPSVVLARAAALEVATQQIKDNTNGAIDYQNVLPYAIMALGDPAVKVRRAASELVQTLKTLYTGDSDSKKKKRGAMKIWPSNNLYGNVSHTTHMKALPSDTAAHFTEDVLVSSLEECILDKSHINAVLEKALNSSKANDTLKKHESGRLTQSSRAALLSFLAGHAISTPLYHVKLRLLRGLNLVKGVASTTRTKMLLPVLQQWAELEPESAISRCKSEHFESAIFDAEAVNIVVANDLAGTDLLEKIVKGEIGSDRPQLVSAVFARFRKMWPSLKDNTEVTVAQLMLSVAQWPTNQPGPSADNQAHAMQLLREVNLSTEVLLSFLSDLPTAAKLADTPPATKRRRVSHGEVAKATIEDTALLANAIQSVTFVLQLTDGSEPEKHPQLLRSLFTALAELQHFKSQVGSELGYLQGLVLSSLLSIMGAFKKDRTLKIDRTAVRADLLVDCVQKTSSPQVQNSALLLIASLAETAPELVLHSVMPIFTFMGSSVLRQNDEFSAHVIKQTISEVIPPLVASLRKEKGNPVTGAAELLLSFVAAYEHVPAHRRKGLFASLVQTLGPEDFLFALLAMLVDKYGASNDIKVFNSDLAASFGVDVQLQTVIKYLDLVQDVLKTKPTISNTLLSLGESTNKDVSGTARKLLELLPTLLSNQRLRSQTSKILERDDMDATRIRELYSTLLERHLVFADTLRADKPLHSACGEVLESLLGLLSTGEFVKSVEGLLDRPNTDLRRKILRSLELRISQENRFNVVARQAILGFLPQLTAIIRESDDILYKHTAVACVDKIAEKYGKMDLEGVAAAAETIASEQCLGQSDDRLRVIALLCLASLVDILREGIMPILPSAIPQAIAYMKASVEADEENEILHNAGYSFVSALLQHLPYMVSGHHLGQILAISNTSAEAALEDDSDESRLSCLHMAAKQIDAKVFFTALDQNWDGAQAAGSLAIREYFDVLSTAVDRHTKSVVAKQSTVLSSIFLKAFDLRRHMALSPSNEVTAEEVEGLEGLFNDVAIKMIYKFNDSTFRPIFSDLLEWASTGLPKKDRPGRILRLQSLYSFMAIFFETLKSIVTNYATYLLENVVEVLRSVDPRDEDSRKLWSLCLATLQQCFVHDQDDFWQAPAHFDAITPVLVAQFKHASSLPLEQALIPTIVELAAAADSADHHKELNSSILKHMRSEAANVRLAAVKCEQALTDKLGEEWLSMLPEMLPFISELQEDDDETVEKETHRWIVKIEGVLGESLDSMLQ